MAGARLAMTVIWAVSFLPSGERQFAGNGLAAAVATEEQQLARARKLLSEVERSPSANLDELRSKLREAQAAIEAVLKSSPRHAEAARLRIRIDSFLSQFNTQRRPEHPVAADAEATLNRLTPLVKTGGPRTQVEELHTRLRSLVQKLESEKPADAARYKKQAGELWDFYSAHLTRVQDLCAGCPALDLASLAAGLEGARLVGAGDYTLDDLAMMAEEPERRKPSYTPLRVGDFNRDGIQKVALIGRGRQKGKDTLFLLIAVVSKAGYRRILLQPLDWHTAALALKDGNLVLSNTFRPGDDFYMLRWNGETPVLHYAGDEMDRQRR